MSKRQQTSLENSLNFYKKIGFTPLKDTELCLFTDGKVIVEINPNRTARAGVKLFRSNWEKEVLQLEQITTITKIDDGFLLSDPSGAWIYLLEKEEKYSIPAGIQTPVTGQFAGISLESTAIETSIKIWKILGFSKTMGAIEQGWLAMANLEGFTISIMKALACPHLFFSPSFTYFNGKENMDIIAKIKALNVPITEEITHFNPEGIVDNIIIRDPGGFGFFIFSD